MDKYLLSNGYMKEVINKVEHGTKIKTTYYTKNNTCVTVLRIGNSKNIISYYDRWDNNNHYGHCAIYGTTEEIIKQIDKNCLPIKEEKVNNKEYIDILPF